MSHPLKTDVLKVSKRKFLATQIILLPKYLSRSHLENAYPHLMFSFTNKKIIGVWSSEVKCIKWMEKSEVIKKRYSENIDWYQPQDFDIISFH